jgi:D-3-phosphoglycerate dehydrogenase
LENVYVTHHIGASTEQAQDAVAEETIKIILSYKNSCGIMHWVNKSKTTSAKYQLIVKHYNKPGVLFSVFELLKEGDINIEDVQNVIFDNGLVACCTMNLKLPATPEMLERISKNENVLFYSQNQI